MGAQSHARSIGRAIGRDRGLQWMPDHAGARSRPIGRAIGHPLWMLLT